MERSMCKRSLRGPRGDMTLPPMPIEFKGGALGSLDPVFQEKKAEPRVISQGLMTAYFDGLRAHPPR
jgi:hypothetical protein